MGHQIFTYPTIATLSTTTMPVQEPHIQVDSLDLEDKSGEERVQMALQAIAQNSFKQNSWPWLSL